MRTGGQRRDVRASALWGSGKRGTGSRSNALWGNGKRRTALLATLVLTLVVPLGASAGPASPKSITAFVAPGLLTSAQSRPGRQVLGDRPGQGWQPGRSRGRRRSPPLPEDGANLQLDRRCRRRPHRRADRHARRRQARDGDHGRLACPPFGSFAGQREVALRHRRVRSTPRRPAATIAVVDSGIDASRPEFAGRIAANVNLTSLPGNSSGDGRGHGTFVAGIAAGAMGGRGGAAPTREDRLARRHGRPGDGEDERRHRRRRLDPRQQGEVRDPRRELLAALVRRQQLHVRPARQGGREALVQQRRRRGGCRQLRQPERAERRPVRTRQRSLRDHRRRERHRQVRLDVRRRRGSVVGVRLHARRLRQAGSRGTRPLHGRARSR